MTLLFPVALKSEPLTHSQIHQLQVKDILFSLLQLLFQHLFYIVICLLALAEIFFYNSSLPPGVIIIIEGPEPTDSPTASPTPKKKSSHSDSVLQNSSYLLPLIIALGVGIGVTLFVLFVYVFRLLAIKAQKVGSEDS